MPKAKIQGMVIINGMAVTPDKFCSQKCAALCVQSVGVGWLNT